MVLVLRRGGRAGLIHYEPMDQMLAAVCGGAMIGLALGIIFAQGATTGGTDLIARLVKLKLPGHLWASCCWWWIWQ